MGKEVKERFERLERDLAILKQNSLIDLSALAKEISDLKARILTLEAKVATLERD